MSVKFEKCMFGSTFEYSFKAYSSSIESLSFLLNCPWIFEPSGSRKPIKYLGSGLVPIFGKVWYFDKLADDGRGLGAFHAKFYTCFK